MPILTPADLAPFATIDEARALAMIADAEAMAVLAAPCITQPLFTSDEGLMAALRAVLRGAILRWHDSGSGVVTQQQAGPFGQTIDTRQVRRGMFWPSEVTQLRDLCTRFSGSSSNRAFSFSPAGYGSGHLPWCSLAFGALYCSCGVDIAGVPIFEDPLP